MKITQLQDYRMHYSQSVMPPLRFTEIKGSIQEVRPFPKPPSPKKCAASTWNPYSFRNNRTQIYLICLIFLIFFIRKIRVISVLFRENK
jgi:hypothetical protein